AEHQLRDDVVTRTNGITFATSGERGSCRSGKRTLESFERGNRLNMPVGLSSGHMQSVNQALLDIPDMSRSRSSSTSSQSIPESGYSTDLSGMFTTPRPIVTRG